MNDSEAASIIQQALIDNGHVEICCGYDDHYRSSCPIDQLTIQIVNSLRVRGAFDEKEL